MRTTITIDDVVAEKLLEVSKKETLVKAVREAIAKYIRMKEKEKILSLCGKIDLDIDLEALRNMEIEELGLK